MSTQIPSFTVDSLVSRVSYIVFNTATAPSGFSTEAQHALSFAMQDVVAKTDMPDFRQEALITTVIDQSEYELPTDFRRIIEPGVYLTTSPKYTLVYYEEQGYIELNGPFHFEESGRPRFYTIRGRRDASVDVSLRGHYVLKLVPSPDTAVTDGIRLSYIAVPLDISSVAGTTEVDVRFPRQHIQAVIWGAVLQFPQHLSIDQQRLWSAKYQEKIQDILNDADPVAGNVHEQRSFPLRRTHLDIATTFPFPGNLSGTDLTV